MCERQYTPEAIAELHRAAWLADLEVGDPCVWVAGRWGSSKIAMRVVAVDGDTIEAQAIPAGWLATFWRSTGEPVASTMDQYRGTQLGQLEPVR